MKDDKKVPQLRFPEFTDAWKQRKLGDILKLLKDGTHGSHKDVTNGHYLLSAKNIKDGRIFWDKTDRIISDEDYKKIHSTFKINKGDVLLTIVGSIGETAIFNVSEEITFQRSVAILRPIDEVSSDFLYSEITSPKFQKFLNLNKSTSAQPGIYLGDLANISFSFPENKEEQKMIGRLFTGLNSTITLQQRKLNSLQKLKKGLLQKMFPKKGENIPEIRFPEFSDAWKQRELGEIAERVTRRNSSLESQTPLTISAEYGLIDQNKFFGKRIAAKDLSNYYLIQKGEFAYNKSTSNDAPWGAIKRLDCYNNGALSTLYIVFKIKDNKSCYSDFLVTYYGTSLWHKEVKEIASEGARNHGLLNVSPSDFFRTKLVIPQDFEEQRKIGAFFTQLDNTITLQQRWLFYTHKQS